MANFLTGAVRTKMETAMATQNLTSVASMTYACSDPEDMVKLLIDLLRWEPLCEGAITQTLEDLWGIAPGSAGDHYTVLRSPGSDRGMIRVVAGNNRKRTTPMSTRWSGVELVVMEDIQEFFKRLENHPDWTIGRPPKTIDFTDAGANIHTYFYAYPPGALISYLLKPRPRPEITPFPLRPTPLAKFSTCTWTWTAPAPAVSGLVPVKWRVPSVKV